MNYSTNNKQFDNLFTKGDIDACFDLFKNWSVPNVLDT